MFEESCFEEEAIIQATLNLAPGLASLNVKLDAVDCV